ncbi:uncharacterized protein FFMR_09143 [Fusarium fujikuroi]|nr:uncharacterized protein FFMR_09143 [Fusarium fujikuroi]
MATTLAAYYIQAGD